LTSASKIARHFSKPTDTAYAQKFEMYITRTGDFEGKNQNSVFFC